MKDIPWYKFSFMNKDEWHFNEIVTHLHHKGYKRRNDVSNALQKYVEYGYLKKNCISRIKTSYVRMNIISNDYPEFLDNVITERKETMSKLLNDLKGKKIFVNIKKNLTSYNLSSKNEANYNTLIQTTKQINKLYMILLWQQDQIDNDETKDRLHQKSSQIKKLVTSTINQLIKDRKSNESAIIKQDFMNKTSPLN